MGEKERQLYRSTCDKRHNYRFLLEWKSLWLGLPRIDLYDQKNSVRDLEIISIRNKALSKDCEL